MGLTGPGCQRMLSVLRRKSADAPWVGLLAWKGKKWSANFPSFSGRFTFPGLETEWSIEATRPHSQWRNRAGLAPDFPVMPVMGTRGEDPYTVAPCTGSSCATNAQRFFSGIPNVRPGTRAPVVHVLFVTSLAPEPLVRVLLAVWPSMVPSTRAASGRMTSRRTVLCRLRASQT